MGEDRELEKSSESNPHDLTRQIVGLILWIGPIAFLAGGLVGVAIGYVLGGLTFADAWTAGIYKRETKSSFLNISPMAWGVVVSMLLIVGFPVYVLNRNKLKTLPGNTALFGSVVLVGSILLVLSLASIYSIVTAAARDV